MGSWKRAAVAVLALILAGCVAQPSPQSAERQFESFIEDVITAEIIAENCNGLRMQYSRDTLIRAHLGQLQQVGYEPLDLAGGFLRTSREEVAFRVLARLVNSGVDPAVPGSFCALGEGEIAAGTRTGSLLI